MEIKAITLWQPYASLVIAGHKQLETRSWQTNYRGPLAIHASKREPPWVPGKIQKDRTFMYYLRAMGLLNYDLWPRGVVLGVVQLVDTYPTEIIRPDLSFEEIAFGDYRPGRFAWRLCDPTPFPKHIPARGRQGLWNWTIPAELIHPINQQEN